MKDFRVYAIRSDGAYFEYENNSWGVHSLTGVGGFDTEIFSINRGNGKGTLVTASRLKERPIEIEFANLIKSERASKRQEAGAFHTYGLTYDLYIEYLGQKRLAKNCIIDEFEIATKHTWKATKCHVSFIASDPILYDTEVKIEKATAGDPMWTPIFNFFKPLPVSIMKDRPTIEIIYGGILPTNFKLSVKATGTASCLVLKFKHNEDAEIIAKLNENLTVATGDFLEIITGEMPQINLNGKPLDLNLYAMAINNLSKMELTNGFNYINLDSNNGKVYDLELKYEVAYGGI